MSQSMRFNQGKPRLSFFIRSFRWVNHAIAHIMTFGAIKYSEDNWRDGGKPDAEYWDSFFRHMDYLFSGEEYDKDSGCHHIGHMIWNLSALMELNYPDKPVIDKKLFKERCDYWVKQKQIRDAADGKVIRTNHVDSVRELKYGGVDKGHGTWENH